MRRHWKPERACPAPPCWPTSWSATTGRHAPTLTQTLGDGTHISRTTTTKVYRDSDGRIRREQTVLGLDALTPGSDAPQIVTIVDPGAGVNYVLDARTRTAHRSRMPQRRVDGRVDGDPVPPPPAAATTTSTAAGPRRSRVVGTRKRPG
ncbi:MAG: hypothetical protein HY047_10440 [Acidobacteria bacterium]|nr:hypothetical protein [Acidobacteriota bacterium]